MQEDTFKIAVVARMKHGVLYEAIKKRGWSIKQAAQFLGIRLSTLYLVINLKKKPPFLFSTKNNEEMKRKARELTEKLMELTGMTVEDLFPESIRTDEFLDKPKVFERSAEVPLDKLIGYRETFALPPTPDQELMEKEDDNEFLEIINELSSEQQHAVKRVLFEGEKTIKAAQERGIGPQGICANIQSAKKKVKEKLASRKQEERMFALSKGIEL